MARKISLTIRGARPSEGSSSIRRRGALIRATGGGEHLPLPAGQRTRELRPAFEKAREQRPHGLERLAEPGRAATPETAQPEVVFDAHRDEQLALLGDEAHPARHPVLDRAARERRPPEGRARRARAGSP